MNRNFVVEIVVGGESIIKLDMDNFNINIFQRCNDKSVKVLEMSGSEETTDPGGHQLSLHASTPDDLDESGDSGVKINANLSDSLTIHSFKYGRGQ